MKVKKIRKAIIPAAGLGTRFLPATKVMPKEMLPIVDKPTIQYIVEEAISSGIEDIIIVTGKNKRAIEDHFDKTVELELNLKEKNKESLLQIVNDITNLADIYYVRQKECLGLGHAVWSARKFIGDEPFAVLLGDMIIDSQKPCMKQLIEVYNEYRTSVIAVEQVDWASVSKYGVIDGNQMSDRLYTIDRLVEKPKLNPPSNIAIMGRYVLEPSVFTILERTSPGIGGEIQLTDALQELAQQQTLLAYLYEGKIYDVGDKLGFLQATIEFASKNDELRDPFYTYMEQFILDRSKKK